MRSWFFFLFLFRTVCSAGYSHRWQHMHWAWKMAINMLWSMWFCIRFKHTEFPSLLLCTLCHFTSVLGVRPRSPESTFSSRILGRIRYSLFLQVSNGAIHWKIHGNHSHMRTLLSSVTTVITIGIYKNAKTNIETMGPFEALCPFLYFQTFLSWWTPILLPWFQLVYFDLYQVTIKLNRW